MVSKMARTMRHKRERCGVEEEGDVVMDALAAAESGAAAAWAKRGSLAQMEVTRNQQNSTRLTRIWRGCETMLGSLEPQLLRWANKP
jgi:mannose/cellobiose epimerase-like protein (N-acyl-D-glucosamine 2-epimerase family)